MDGLTLLRRLGEELETVPAIMITGKGSEERAVAAIEAGAFWYIEKPLKGAVLRALLDRALGKARDRQQVAALTRQLREAGRIGELVGSAKAMQDVMRIVEQVAPSSASVLITGETGSGKEILARTIHQLSPRAERPFVAINCSAIPESLMESEIFGHEKGAFTGAAERRIGCFELADGGTCCSTKLAKCPRPRRPSFSACWKTTKCGAWAAKPKRRGRARARRHQQGSRTGRGPRPVAPGSLFPPERLSHSSAPVARSQGRSAAAGRAILQRPERQAWAPGARDQRRSGRAVPGLRLARQCPRTAQRSRARHHRLRPRPDRPRAPARPILGVRHAAGASELSALRFPLGTTVDAVERELILQTLAATNNKTRAAELLGISLKTLHNKLKEYEAAKSEGR